MLILAGDVSNGLPEPGSLAWMSALSQSELWPQGLLMVLGNHDYYGLDLHLAASRWREALEPTRIRLLNRDVARIGTVRIAGCTLWTDYDKGDRFSMLMAQRGLADHHLIVHEGRCALPKDLLEVHTQELEFLTAQAPGSDNSPLVVVTHHAPSRRSISPAFEGDVLNPAFVSDLEPVMGQLRPTVWIHGHVHSHHDYLVGSTRVICHPLGYPGEIGSDGSA